MQINQSLSPSFALPIAEAQATKLAHYAKSQSTPSQTATSSTSVSLSSAAREAAASELKTAPSPAGPRVDIPSKGQNQAMGWIEWGQQTYTALRPALATTAEVALNVAYLAELSLELYAPEPKLFSKAEYVKQHDVGSVLGYIRDLLSEPTQGEDPSADAGASGLDTASQKGWSQLERWAERLSGSKMDYTEFASGAAAISFLFTSLSSAHRP